MFANIDALLDENPSKAYDELKKLYDGGESKNAEVLWRLARACHLVAGDLEGTKKKDTIFEGREFALAAFAAAPDSFDAVKYAAVLTCAAMEFLGTKERMEQGARFKEFLDKAHKMDPSDYSLLHIRGRYTYSVANIGLLMRKVVSALFTAPPEATFDEALRDFELANTLKPGWIENVMYIARVFIAKKENARALPFLKEVIRLRPTDDSKREIQAEARQLVEKFGK